MLISEIIIARLFELRIKCCSKRVHYLLKALVKMPGVFLIKIVRGKVGTSSKPTVDDLVFFIIQFKITPIGMDCWYIWINGMNNNRYSAGKPFISFKAQLCPHTIGNRTVNNGSIHARFFE